MVIRLASGEERAVFCPARAPLRIDRAKQKAARNGTDLWGPMAAAVPTTVATLDYALRRYGTMSAAEVLGPAIEAAESGYRIQSFERSFLGDYTRRLFDSEVLSPVYLTGPTGDSGIPDPAPTGTCVKIPGLADTLRRLAEAGLSDFYTGTIAARLDEDVRAAGGFLQRSDLARVPASVLDTSPVRGTYRGLTVVSVPSPAGGSVLVMALQILDELPAATLAAAGAPARPRHRGGGAPRSGGDGGPAPREGRDGRAVPVGAAHEGVGGASGGEDSPGARAPARTSCRARAERPVLRTAERRTSRSSTRRGTPSP